jgi:single-strand DNA-binding protein
MADNNVTLVGNVTREPELRYTPSGQAMAKFGLAVNRRWQNKASGEWEEATSFFDVVAWREMAENVGDSVQKGTRVIVTGRMEQRSYETQQGEKRSAVELIADEVGPSLRWATAKVERNERRSGEGGERSGGGASSARPAPSAPAAPAYADEEPF